MKRTTEKEKLFNLIQEWTVEELRQKFALPGKPGRKPLGPPVVKVNFCCRPAVREKLERLCKKHKLGPSAILTQLIEQA